MLGYTAAILSIQSRAMRFTPEIRPSCCICPFSCMYAPRRITVFSAAAEGNPARRAKASSWRGVRLAATTSRLVGVGIEQAPYKTVDTCAALSRGLKDKDHAPFTIDTAECDLA